MPSDWDPRYRAGGRLTDQEAYELGRRMAQQHGAIIIGGAGYSRYGSQIELVGCLARVVGVLLVLGGGFFVLTAVLAVPTAIFGSTEPPTGLSILLTVFLLGGLVLLRIGIRMLRPNTAQDPIHATFFAFRNTGSRGVLLRAAVAFVALASLAVGAFYLFNAWSGSDHIIWSQRSRPLAWPTAGSQGIAAGVMTLAVSFAFLIAAPSILLASFEAACLRWMARDELPGLFGLTLGADTWRVWRGYWVWALIVGALGLPFVLAGIADTQDARPAIVELARAAAALVAIYVFVRLGPAAATSIACRRFAFLDAWKVTRGRFLELLGSHLLLLVVFWIALGVALFLTGVIVAGTGLAPPRGETPSIAFVAPFGTVLSIALITYAVAVFGIGARAAQAVLEDGVIARREKRADTAIRTTKEPEPARAAAPPTPPVQHSPPPAAPSRTLATIKRLIIFLANHRPSDEPWYVRQLLPAIGLSMSDLEGAQIDFRYVTSDQLNRDYIAGVALADGIDLEDCILTPFNDADGGQGQVLQVQRAAAATAKATNATPATPTARKDAPTDTSPSLDTAEFDRCPNCGAAQHKHGVDLELAIYACGCGKRYCDNCSAGGLITLPFCPGARTPGGLVSSQHPSDRQRIGRVRRAPSPPADTVSQPDAPQATSPMQRDTKPSGAAGGLSDAEMVRKLTQLAECYARGATNESLAEQVKAIGRALNERGGISEMRRVFKMVPAIQGKRTVEMEWDGIGDWWS